MFSFENSWKISPVLLRDVLFMLQFDIQILNCQPFSRKAASLTSRLLSALRDHDEQAHCFNTQLYKKKKNLLDPNVVLGNKISQNWMSSSLLTAQIPLPPTYCHRCCDFTFFLLCMQAQVEHEQNYRCNKLHF